MIIEINKEIDSLEKIIQELNKNSDYEYKIKRDRWSDELIANKKCIVVKKSASHGAKIRFVERNIVEVLAITPSAFIPYKGVIGYFVQLAIEKGKIEVVENTINNLKNI